MSKKKNEETANVVDNVIPAPFNKVLDESYIKYAFKVIEDRAIPDARDGLKPSQRRILVAMDDLNLRPERKHLKCAKICGDTSGNYHPHGEAVIYPTLVNLAQTFGIRHPLIDPQGNFGSVDGDPPAAMRYTEARLSHLGQAMLEDLSKHTVDFQRNFDDRLDEPTVLPTRIPNLILNGVSGIAVGYATNIPPHNYREVANLIEAYIKNPDLSTSEILHIMPGPDFPTGGRILGQSGIIEYYETGKGSVKLEGVYNIESTKSGRETIVITEFPEGGAPEIFRREVQELVNKEKISGITDCPNYSSRKNGIRVVVEIGKNSNANIVLNQLLAHTCLRKSFSVNSTVLIDGKLYDKAPIKTLLKAFIDHRVDVLTRKFKAELADNLQKIEILEGLINVTKNIDQTIKIIKDSDSPEDASKNLINKNIVKTEIQAKAVLAITLAKLTKLEQNQLFEDKKKREERVVWLNNILSNNSEILSFIVAEQKNLAEKLGNERRTKIESSATEIGLSDLIPVEEVVVSISTDNYIKRVPLNQYRQQGRGGAGVKASDLKEEVFMQSMFVASTHDDLLCFADSGRVFKLKVYELPEASRSARGRPVVNFVNLKENENVCNYLPIKESIIKNKILVFISAEGLVKRIPLKEFEKINKGGLIATKLKDGDKLVKVLLTNGVDDVLIVSHEGQALRFSEMDIRIISRNAAGVSGMNVQKSKVVGAISIPMRFDSDGYTTSVDKDLTMVTITSKGYGKRTLVDEYLVDAGNGKLRQKNRGGKGVIDINLNSKIGNSISSIALKGNNDVVVVTKQGQVVRIPAEEIRTTSKGTMGTRLIKLSSEDEVITACPVAEEVQENSEVE